MSDRDRDGIGSRIGRRIRSLQRLVRIQSQFWPYVRAYRGRIGIAVLLSLLYAGLRLLEPWPLQILFDQALLDKKTSFLGLDPLALLGGNKMTLLLVSSASILIVASCSGAIYYIQNILIARAGQDIVYDLRKDVFHQMQRLALPFHRRASSGDLLMRMTGDMILLREMILATLVTLTTQTLLLVSVVALMFSVSLRLTLVAVVLAPILYFLFRTFRRRMIDAARKQRRREGRLAAGIEEVLLAIPMIQAFTAEATEDERFRRICKRSARAGLRAARLEAQMQRMVEVTIAIGTSLVLLFGVREVLNGRLTPGVLLVFLAYLRAVYRPVRGISKVTERTARASAAAERVLEVLRAAREIKDSHKAVAATIERGEIQFSNVSFSYENGTAALRGVDFHIAPGERVALVGPTGAGKSTLFSLILRFHNPTEGNVFIDGRKTRHYTLASLRRQVTLLTQDPFIMGSTIRENLLYGKPDATDVELLEALRFAALDEYVLRLSDGLDSKIQSRGQSLSGGQKQRLAIARAILKDSPILLLDEPTTGLDARSERDVLERLERLRTGRTTLTIAHHFATVRSADRVLVLDGGRLVEDGPPDKLLSSDSLFRLLAEIQGMTQHESTSQARPLAIDATTSPVQNGQ